MHPSGAKIWRQNGKRHRSDVVDGKLQPTEIDEHGNKSYWINGQFINYK